MAGAGGSEQGEEQQSGGAGWVGCSPAPTATLQPAGQGSACPASHRQLWLRSSKPQGLLCPSCLWEREQCPGRGQGGLAVPSTGREPGTSNGSQQGSGVPLSGMGTEALSHSRPVQAAALEIHFHNQKLLRQTVRKTQEILLQLLVD